MRGSRLVSLALAIVVPLGCGGGGGDNDSGITNPGLACTTTSNGTFTATLNGKTWVACGPVTVRTDVSFLSVKDTLRTVSWAGSGFLPDNAAYAIVMSASKLNGGGLSAGTYAVGLVNPTNSNFIVGSSNNAGWSASPTGGTGSITITSITGNHITGTFTFDAAPTTGTAVGTLQVRNGRFDLSF
jgi:hypothetical protein